MSRTFLAAALLALGACSGAFGERVHEAFHQAIPSGATPIVHVDNIAGSVRIETWAKPEVDVEATKYGYDAGELRSIIISLHSSGDGIFIVTTYSGGNHSGGVRYKIMVPAAASVQVGNIAGAVDVIGVGGNVSVETQAGTIYARLGRVAGGHSIDLRATTGTVELRIASNSDATVDAQSTVGGFESDFSAISEARENVVGAHAGGKLGSGSANIRLSTTTGAISLRSD